ncbi:biotin/lipoate A/B protein ligase family protein [Sulfurimonas sp. C5]|uniref:lipoate--protein ligase family protein n=1 Tax=Sulfurimonas sp. C5 TaxID=3036947 RepID=UPI0024542FC6|nr:biotin/lipoate A/B protein ligase family protein [Sulfurimonas sp. C5]MDH4943971.1 biotin/lipoate A/B protein ligase family protein [Sulfurimonas sp. C5]
MQKIIKKFRLLDTPVANASYNMAVDEVLLQSSIDSGIPILRIYEWENALSFGRFNKIHEILDLTTVDLNKISYARRLTGGGVLVHGGDISYSLIMPKTALHDLSPKESYRYLCSFLINFYKKLGLEPKFAQDENLHISKSNICTASNEPYDITINAKKIGGNAQRYSKKTLFQHGSIPLSVDTKLFEKLFLENAHLEDINTLEKLGLSSSKDELKKLMIHSFIESFNVELIDDTLTEQEFQKIDKLQKTKYDTYRWNIDAIQL